MGDKYLWEYLKTATKPIVLYGMGNGAEYILDHLAALGCSVSGIFASDEFVRYQQFRGFTVSRYSELKEKYGEMIILLAFGTHRKEVMDNVRRLMREQEVYIPDMPVIGKTIFDHQFAAEHRPQLQRVYDMLSDEKSRRTYESIIKAKLSGVPDYYFNCESEINEAYGLFELGDNEAYFDIGAYNGDTVLRFCEMTGSKYRNIVAIEPNIKNFNRLVRNTASCADLKCYNYCVGDFCGKINVAKGAGRNANCLEGTGDEIEAVTIDFLMDNQEVSLIKIDVEGMEAAVLRGGAKTIERCRPAMDLAAYHRAEDLFLLPLLVNDLCPIKKLYFRHFSALPSWDSNFYIKF